MSEWEAVFAPCTPAFTLHNCSAAELFLRKLVSRVAARIAQESLGRDERELAAGGSAATATSSFYMGQQDAALGVASSPLAGILPDLFLPPQ